MISPRLSSVKANWAPRAIGEDQTTGEILTNSWACKAEVTPKTATPTQAAFKSVLTIPPQLDLGAIGADKTTGEGWRERGGSVNGGDGGGVFPEEVGAAAAPSLLAALRTFLLATAFATGDRSAAGSGCEVANKGLTTGLTWESPEAAPSRLGGGDVFKTDEAKGGLGGGVTLRAKAGAVRGLGRGDVCGVLGVDFSSLEDGG